MDEKMNKTLMIVTAILDCYKDEEQRETAVLEKIEFCENLAEDFSCMLDALHVLYIKLTGDHDIDLIGFTHFLNRLAIDEIVEEEDKKDE